MSTTTIYEPLYAVPPAPDQRAHMALLLRMRDIARAAYDAAVSAPERPLATSSAWCSPLP